MNERKLLLLGLLLTQSQHGYQINDFIEENLSEFVEVKRSTAYSTLNSLVADGCIETQMEQAGHRPPRKVYSLTNDGKRLFDELLKEYLVKLDGFSQPVEIALMYVDSLPRQELLEYLEQRLTRLEQSIRVLEAVPSHDQFAGVDMAVSHRRRIMRAEQEWLAEQLQQLRVAN